MVHGSQPRFTVPEIIQDMNRAVRFIRHHAKDYGIDPDRIGVYGGSAGGHLSLMLGTAGDKGDPKAKDPVDRESSRVQAVACFFPPTDFLNFGKPGKEMLHATDHQPPFRAAFDYRELDKATMLWKPITDEGRLREITRQISPITYVTPDDPPTLIIHGDADKLVPLQQSELIVEKLKKTGVETKLVVKKGAGHGWAGLDKDLAQFADWFDGHLAKPRPGDELRSCRCLACGLVCFERPLRHPETGARLLPSEMATWLAPADARYKTARREPRTPGIIVMPLGRGLP